MEAGERTSRKTEQRPKIAGVGNINLTRRVLLGRDTRTGREEYSEQNEDSKESTTHDALLPEYDCLPVISLPALLLPLRAGYGFLSAGRNNLRCGGTFSRHYQPERYC